MDNPIYIDRNMAHVIMSAFCVASFEGHSSLIANSKCVKKDAPESEDFASAEHRLLRVLNSAYPDVVAQYFNISDHT